MGELFSDNAFLFLTLQELTVFRFPFEVERLVFDIVEVTEDLIKEAQSKIPAHEREPEHGDNQKAREKISNGHGKGERQASKHGEGVRPTGHDSVC